MIKMPSQLLLVGLFGILDPNYNLPLPHYTAFINRLIYVKNATFTVIF